MVEIRIENLENDETLTFAGVEQLIAAVRYPDGNTEVKIAARPEFLAFAVAVLINALFKNI